MGRPKPLLPWGATTVVGSVVAALQGGGVEEIVLVAAPADQELQDWGSEAGLAVAINPHPERGMLTSILTGLAHLATLPSGAGSGTILLCPADLPALTTETVATLLRRMAETGALLAVPVHRGRRGHPLALSPLLLPEIAALDLSRGLNQLVDRRATDLLEVPVDDPGCVRDIDTPDEYRALAADLAALPGS